MANTQRRTSTFATSTFTASSDPVFAQAAETSQGKKLVENSQKVEKKSQEAPVEKERMASFYVPINDANRIREALLRTQVDEGTTSMSDFVHKAVMREVQRLEKKYNEGKPYEGIVKTRTRRR